MRFKGMCIAVLCSATAVSGGTAFGQMCKGGSGMKGSSNFSAHDKMFLHKASAGNLAEIKLGQMAAEKGASDDVKRFGQKMVDDHTKLGDTMKPLLEQANIPVPTTLTGEEAALEKKLSGLSGEAFDKQYVAAMVKDHHHDLAAFKMEESSTKNDQLKAAVSSGEQVIQEHTNMIDGIAPKHGVSAPHSSM